MTAPRGWARTPRAYTATPTPTRATHATTMPATAPGDKAERDACTGVSTAPALLAGPSIGLVLGAATTTGRGEERDPLPALPALPSELGVA